MNALRVTTIAAFLAVAPLSDAGAASDDVASGDTMMARIAAQYHRTALDRGGWDNPHLPSVAAGNPIIAIALGSGVTLGTATDAEVTSDDSLTPSFASIPKAGEASEERGAGSGEPESQPPEVQSEAELLESIWTMP